MWEPNIKFDNNNNNNNNNNVGGLVGDCGARAVSRKTPIFFINIVCDFLKYACTQNLS